MIRLNVLSVGIVAETGGILVVLRAPELQRLLIFETGLLEGQAIALEAEGVRSERPLTQDLLHEVIQRLGARVQEVQIREFRDEAFIARIVLGRPDGGISIEVDARPSDAIALAQRGGAAIFVAEEIIAEMGVPEEKEGRFAALFAEEDEDEDEDEELPERTVH